MRFIRYGNRGQEKPALIDKNGIRRDLSGIIDDINGKIIGHSLPISLPDHAIDALPIIPPEARLGTPLTGIGKIVGVALNYRMHAAETGAKIPSEPVLFLKATTALSGPDDDILLPPQSEKTDWEVELGVVIGKVATNVSPDDAMMYIAGYCVLDDVSERAFQLERGGQQHTKGKSADSFCPIGPMLVTKDDVANPQNLRLWTKVNGILMQDGWTGDMLFTVAQLVSYISEFMTLEPGDVIATGTPDGVGKGRTPPVYLRENDIVELGIEGLGQQKHFVRRRNAL